MKDRLGEQAITDLATVLCSITDLADREIFIEQANKGLTGLALKQRVDFLVGLLAVFLPDDFEKAAACLLMVDIPEARQEQWGDFTAWPLVDYARVYGLAHPELSLNLLKHLTSLFSAEFAIRPFIDLHQELSFDALLRWAEDDSEHIRRLASEGSRPRLPWGKHLKKWIANPDEIFLILDKLKDDPSLYVRRSVANNLNDISKDHPEKVIRLCKQWQQGASKERQWLIKHGLRSLVKAGWPEVFPLLGYTEKLAVDVKQFDVSPESIVLGEAVTIKLCLQSINNKQQKVVVDYAVDFVKANGQRVSKVFKWKNISLEPHEKIVLIKKHHFKEINTRRYYSGGHRLWGLLNGVKTTQFCDFYLSI